MKTVPHWRRRAARHARRVKDQVALYRQAERMNEQQTVAQESEPPKEQPE